MKQYETQNYIFYYQENSTADRDIVKIAQIQQSYHEYICSVLKTTPTFKIEYFLCETAEDVGHAYGDNEPCNGFASLPNRIFRLMNYWIMKCSLLMIAPSHIRLWVLLQIG